MFVNLFRTLDGWFGRHSTDAGVGHRKWAWNRQRSPELPQHADGHAQVRTRHRTAADRDLWHPHYSVILVHLRGWNSLRISLVARSRSPLSFLKTQALLSSVSGNAGKLLMHTLVELQMLQCLSQPRFGKCCIWQCGSFRYNSSGINWYSEVLANDSILSELIFVREHR